MVPKVLIVDDDQSWLSLMEKELANYAENFIVHTADSGEAALTAIKRNHIMLVVSDLRMPGMDGFDLLSRILEGCPDIPVIIVTAYDRPKTKDVVFRSGAAGYLTKPIASDVLAREINKMLRKKAEGGNLNNVSLETFLQLVEMEQQTCTLQVLNKAGNTGGVLFFRNGELFNARIGDQQGKSAAYEILSWSSVSVSIENECVFAEKLIEGDLQAILLDAMRSKDENEEARQASAAGENEIVLDEPVDADNPEETKASEGRTDNAAEEAASESSAEAEAPEEELSPVESASRRLTASLGSYTGVKDIYEDAGWAALVSSSASMGEIFGFGELSVVYANKGGEGQYLVMPGEETTVISIDPDAPRDKIIGAVS